MSEENKECLKVRDVVNAAVASSILFGISHCFYYWFTHLHLVEYYRTRYDFNTPSLLDYFTHPFYGNGMVGSFYGAITITTLILIGIVLINWAAFKLGESKTMDKCIIKK